MSRTHTKRMLLAFAMLLGFLLIAFATSLGLLLWSQSEPLEISRKLPALRPWFFLWRLLLFGSLIIAFWPAVCRSLARWRNLTDIQHQRLRSARWQVAAWLIALELLLGQNVVGRFIHLLGA